MAYKVRVPNWKNARADSRKFVVQFHEMMTDETACIYDSQGIMMSEDRYVLKMSKPGHGGFSGSDARAKFADFSADPMFVKDRKNSVRVSLDPAYSPLTGHVCVYIYI